jgi:ubiquinone/menaquinone biosynthesis C-methylase UbiE
LDVGCGTGWWLERLTLHGFAATDLFGVDVSGTRVSAAQQRIPEADVSVADARSLPFADQRFGLVILMLVLSSLPDATAVQQTLHEALRVTANGGVIAIWEPRVPNPLNPDTRLIRLEALQRELGADISVRSVTLAPSLARALGRHTEALYQQLARIPILRTHRLIHYRRPPAAA